MECKHNESGIGHVWVKVNMSGMFSHIIILAVEIFIHEVKAEQTTRNNRIKSTHIIMIAKLIWGGFL